MDIPRKINNKRTHEERSHTQLAEERNGRYACEGGGKTGNEGRRRVFSKAVAEVCFRAQKSDSNRKGNTKRTLNRKLIYHKALRKRR